MRKMIAANWKMNLGGDNSMAVSKDLAELLKGQKNSDVVICPPFTSLHSVNSVIKGSGIRLGAQNMHYEDAGAFTGEISPSMIKSLGCEYVILGHSERREFFREDDILINRKVASALKHGLNPILCVGETWEQRQNKWTQEVLEKQLSNCLNGISPDKMKQVTVAYEPVWAISRGNPDVKAATPEDAEIAHQLIRNFLSMIFEESIAFSTRLLYGGSMKPENAKELLSRKGIDGGLVGNASLNAKGFADIVKAAN